MSGDQHKKKASKPEQQASQGVQADTAAEAQAGPAVESKPEGQSPAPRDVEELREQKAQLEDQLLRRAAEFENFRKRMFRERDEGIKFANAALLADIMPVIDDLERAIASAEESRNYDALHDGVSMIERQLVSMLERNWGLKRYSAVGEPFDPQRHEAIAVQESSEHAEAMVLEDFQKGYILHDRVLRPAKVRVSKPVDAEQAEGKDSTSSK